MENTENSRGELAAALVRGTISAVVPYIGGVIAEVGNLYLNPLERRKKRWIEEVTSAINEIEVRFSLLPQTLETNEQFVSFLYHATIIALKDHRTEKLRALRNALISVAEPTDIAEDLSFQFLRYVDEFSPSHLRVLCWIDESMNSLPTNLEELYVSFQQSMSGPLDRAHFRVIVRDLDARLLVHLGDIDDFPEYASLKSHILLQDTSIRPLTLTTLGRAFVDFVHAKTHETVGPTSSVGREPTSG